ncbi:DUF3575 domain-containing protein [Flavobacterium psychrophilum]|jgi:hypothetical protein|uniref:DUF3575 domain-containing protein n=2 Tax=Flavobacterium psychrophilum TaxID=96345 RepID=A0A7U2NHX4_FLAPS|nr:DUF3575 domain-containing protein [Flavobacterium psychrophilum]MBF2092719.1 DUF3575 domain-containing protein [Flavobacterium psychrophilum]OJH13834.1 DUF3575 domain-containing protein [Flavobacterium psychrophilum]QRE05383.1 DUF3575 domain-containing protein [Flavobacterium psychrophilum]
MKKTFLAIVLLFSFFVTKAQNKNDNIVNLYEKKNEVILDLIGPSFGGGINASYERHLNKKSSLGITFFYIYDNTKETDMNYSISPYYRMYFGKKYASGFFVEGFGMVMSIDGKKIYDTEEKITFTENPDVINLSIGVGIGWKGVTKSGFTYGANLGWGKMLFNADKTDHTQVAKFSLNVGYRF